MKIVAATPTSITVTVAKAAACVPTRMVSVSVKFTDQVATVSAPLRVAVPLALAVGQSTVIRDSAALACSELPGGIGEYAAVVVNRSARFTSPPKFRFFGRTGAAGAIKVDPAESRSIPMDTRERAPRGHRSRVFHSGVGPPKVTVEQGELRKFYVPYFVGACIGSSGVPPYITARAVYIGAKVIVWEDLDSERVGTRDAEYAQIGSDIDSYYATATRYFGDPVMTDSVTDRDQHFAIIFSPYVRATTDGGELLHHHLGGYMSDCDFTPFSPGRFFPHAHPNYSNFGEYVYEPALTSPSTASGLSIAHTLQHLITEQLRFLARRAGRSQSYGGLGEGMPAMAEEIFMRTIGAPLNWKANGSFPECCGTGRGRSPIEKLHFQINGRSGTDIYGDEARQPVTFTGQTWSFLRWYVDRYAFREDETLRLLTNNSISVSWLADLVVLPQETLIANWALALLLDDIPAFSANPDVNIPTWNLPAIFAEFNRRFPSQYSRATPLAPIPLSFGDFVHESSALPHGFRAYRLSEVGPGPHVFGLTAEGGTGAVPSNYSMGIARLQ